MNSKDPKREAFIKQNLGLVHTCARRFANKGIEYDDLYSAGCIGIVKAYDAFDDKMGVKFSTYAVPVILGEIKRLFRDGGTVKVSRSLKDLYMKIIRQKESMLLKKGSEPTIQELANKIGVMPEQVAEAIAASSSVISLTDDDENGGGQIDIKYEESEEKLTDKIAIKDALCKLEKRDRHIILMRYFSGRTQSETSKELNMTQVQVSRREKKILALLREQLKSN